MTPDLVRRPLVAGRDGLAASDPDGGAVASSSTGSKIEPSLLTGSAVRASLRQAKRRLCATPRRRATSLTTAPVERSSAAKAKGTAVANAGEVQRPPQQRGPKVGPVGRTRAAKWRSRQGFGPGLCARMLWTRTEPIQTLLAA